MALAPEQVAFFHQNGFLLIDRFLGDGELERLRQAYGDTVERLRAEGTLRNASTADDSGDGNKVFQLRTAHLLHAAFLDHIRNPLFLDIVEALIGRDIQLVHYQGLYKPARAGGEVGWHQDDTYWPSSNAPEGSVSLWVPLDDASVENGCMWYVPGSHSKLLEHGKRWDPKDRKGFYYAIENLDPRLAERAIPAEVKAGGIAIHSGGLVHGSRANRSDRERRALASHFINPKVRDVGGVFESAAPEIVPVLRRS